MQEKRNQEVQGRERKKKNRRIRLSERKKTVKVGR